MTGTNQPMHTTPFHPGFDALNWISEIVGWDANGSRSGSPYGNARWGAAYHQLDALKHERADAVYVRNGLAVPFNVPWDTYNANIIPTPVTTAVNMSVNVGVRGTRTIPVTIPTLPLTLP